MPKKGRCFFWIFFIGTHAPFRPGLYLPTRHLLGKGCRKIAHIRSLDMRYQGYRKALQDGGLPETPELVCAALEDFGAEAGREAVRHWIKNGLEFDALVAESDHQALGAISELISHGRRVPEDVKVFGVDDSPLCTVGSVPISSVSQQIEETGAQAVSMILKRINKEPPASVAIQPVLRLRASTGDGCGVPTSGTHSKISIG